MIDPKLTHRTSWLIAALAVSVLASGCTSTAFETAEAESLVKQQFPDAELEIINARVDPEGRGVALARFNDQVVSFFFQPLETGWALEAVDYDGSFYYIRDLEQISATMVAMADFASALESYSAAHGSYPEGEDGDALQALVPDFMPEGTAFVDTWERPLIYESDGDDYTLISQGADQQSGTNDDIILHSGEFVGASGTGPGDVPSS